MNPCVYFERGWIGYFVDVATMGGYTAYKAHEYTKCIQSQKNL